ncbi:glycosyltransferase involved in cell wall biosynthesis [Methylobacterium sp. BE186]|uniref:glycosyltransferase n=1 Tax=Methylobacterium sp. BE186 TaxID=2817715 RepID=UPI002859D1F4|nr:glycosyltransferase [Methylobacterium sp. BE186]MDR7039981.1 glycosyltransferase involved in cell wall biosynthesis [Methylobacterium sp. BE186]
MNDRKYEPSKTRDDQERIRPKVAIINSIAVKNDAISASVVDTYKSLAYNNLFEVSLFCYKNDFTEIPARIISGVNELIFDRGYLDADVILWHFGIYYELFNAALLGNGHARRVVRFHNITPKEFVPVSAWDIIDQSNRQSHFLRSVDEVWADSFVNAEAARSLGVQPSRIQVIPLIVDEGTTADIFDKSSSDVKILFVGRFVSSKGVLELLQVVDRLCQRGNIRSITLNLVGNIEFSDIDYIDKLTKFIDINGLSRIVNMLGSVTSAELLQLYRDSHILAIPSYHEGFCKPVIEGLRNSCIPVGYAAYNVPYVANDLGRLVEPGDLRKLEEAFWEIANALPGALISPNLPRLPLDMGYISAAEFTAKSRSYVEQFSGKIVGATMRSRLHRLLEL